MREHGRFCLSPQNIIEFAAVATRVRFVDPPLSADKVAEIAAKLYSSRKLGKIYPARGTVIRAMREGRILGKAGNAWYDVYLAMTMRDAGVGTVVTENARDFAGLDFINVMGIEEAAGMLR